MYNNGLIPSAVIVLVVTVSLWVLFQRAGRHGWAAIIPIYSQWVLFDLVGLPGWLAILLVIPVVQIIPIICLIVAYYRLPKDFGKNGVYGVLSVFLPFITFPILALSGAQYQATAAGQPIQETPYPTTPPTPPAPPAAPMV